MEDGLAVTANLLGDRGRAAILMSLMGGIALPAGELARIANVSPQTVSGHLAKLVTGRLLGVERQGRHRYFRLANAEVADAIEALLVLTAKPDEGGEATRRPTPGSLAHARTCYSHLAGWLGVQIASSLEKSAYLVRSDARTYTVTPSGRAWFEGLGIPVSPADIEKPKFARRCLDWTERRHHVAGTLGCAMYKRFKELKWVAPIRDTRAVRVTVEGRGRLWDELRIAIG